MFCVCVGKKQWQGNKGRETWHCSGLPGHALSNLETAGEGDNITRNNCSAKSALQVPGFVFPYLQSCLLSPHSKRLFLCQVSPPCCMFFATPNTYIVFSIMRQSFPAGFLPPSVIMCVLALLAPAHWKCLKAFVFLELRSQQNTSADLYQCVNTPSRSLYPVGEETLVLRIAGSSSGH